MRTPKNSVSLKKEQYKGGGVAMIRVDDYTVLLIIILVVVVYITTHSM